jgi:hypothetical protein
MLLAQGCVIPHPSQHDLANTPTVWRYSNLGGDPRRGKVLSLGYQRIPKFLAATRRRVEPVEHRQVRIRPV